MHFKVAEVDLRYFNYTSVAWEIAKGLKVEVFNVILKHLFYYKKRGCNVKLRN